MTEGALDAVYEALAEEWQWLEEGRRIGEAIAADAARRDAGADQPGRKDAA